MSEKDKLRQKVELLKDGLKYYASADLIVVGEDGCVYEQNPQSRNVLGSRAKEVLDECKEL